MSASLPIRRREFLAFGVAASCGAAAMPLRRLEELQCSDFAERIGECFVVSGGRPDSAVRLVLEECRPRRFRDARPRHVRPIPFSLVFSASGQDWDSGVCRMQHPELGRLDVLLTRITAADGKSQKFEAVFA